MRISCGARLVSGVGPRCASAVFSTLMETVRTPAGGKHRSEAPIPPAITAAGHRLNFQALACAASTSYGGAVEALCASTACDESDSLSFHIVFLPLLDLRRLQALRISRTPGHLCLHTRTRSLRETDIYRMPFAQLVLGAPGSGKSTYCDGSKQIIPHHDVGPGRQDLLCRLSRCFFLPY